MQLRLSWPSQRSCLFLFHLPDLPRHSSRRQNRLLRNFTRKSARDVVSARNELAFRIDQSKVGFVAVFTVTWESQVSVRHVRRTLSIRAARQASLDGRPS